MRKHFTWVNVWYGMGLVVLALTALGIGASGHHPWAGLGAGLVCIIWARVEQLDRRYRTLVVKHQTLLIWFLDVLSRESGNPPSVPPV